jgi:tetratricopeptide (TPR) repeat protein
VPNFLLYRALILGGLMSLWLQPWPRAAFAQEAVEAREQNREQSSAQAHPIVPKGPPALALEHYNRGREHYQAGRYRDAILELEIAVNLDPYSPNLAYNVARVYELLGEIDHAIAFYRRYRDLLPVQEQAERERIALTLQRLEGARVHTAQPNAQPLTVRKRGVADAAFWSVASGGAAALAACATTGVLALTTEHQSERFRLGRDGGEKGRQELIDRADRLALASDAMLVIGASLGVSAILMYALRVRTVTVAPTRAHLELDVRASREGALLALRGRL